MTQPTKRSDNKIFRFHIGKRWKFLRYSLWVVSFLFVLTATTFPWATRSSNSTQVSLHVWALSFFVYLLEAIIVPYTVRALVFQLRFSASLFNKFALAFTAICAFTTFHLSIFLGLLYYLDRSLGFLYSEHLGFLIYLALGYVCLFAWTVLMMARELSEQMTDSIRLLSNGMNMAGKLDFDAAIATVERDELGRLSTTFIQMAHLIKTRINLLQALFNNVRIFSGLLGVEKILDHAQKAFESLKESEAVVISVWDPHTRELVVARSSINNSLDSRFSIGQGVLGNVIRERQFMVYKSEDYLKMAKEFEGEARIWGKPGLVVVIPMLFKGELKGAITLYGVNLGDFQLDSKMDYFQALANQIANFLENARLYELVVRDRLTGLYVHSFIEASMEDILAQSKRYNFPVCFFMLDGDKFKSINDQYGHQAGNRMIIALAETIRSVSRAADLPGRFGGDEFEVLLPHTDREGGLIYAQKLRDAVEKMSVELAPGVQNRITVSIGMAVYPADAKTAVELHAAADAALYSAKAQGRNRTVAYDSIPH